MTTDTEHITELREAADEAQAARLEAITEIVRLTRLLREVEDERNTAISELFETRLALQNSLAKENAHLKTRLERMENSYRDTWPKWNNDDVVAVHTILDTLHTLEREREAQKAVTG